MQKTADVSHADQGIAPEVSDVRLSEMLRKGTHALHVQAERSGIINDILRGRASRHGYTLLLRNLLPPYEAMETALELHKQSPGACAFARPELFRSHALRHDLDQLCGVNWRETLPVLPAARSYAARILDANEGNGIRLLGHAYARYLGDLSGGQILSRLLAKTFAMDSSALSFYAFPGINDISRFKDQCRDTLDREIVAADAKAAVVQEAKAAFSCNIALSEAVQQSASEGLTVSAPT